MNACVCKEIVYNAHVSAKEIVCLPADKSVYNALSMFCHS